jgi:chromosomal replication initiator protein
MDFTHFLEDIRRYGADTAAREICRARGIRHVTDLCGSSRHKTVAMARHELMAWFRARTGLSYPEIGMVFGRDHTTIISAVQKVDRMMASDDHVRARHAIPRDGESAPVRFRVVE